MLVHFQIARMDSQIKSAVTSDLLQHVIEETETCGDITFTCSVQIETNVNIRFLGRTTNLRRTFSGKKELRDFCPSQA